MKVSINGWWIVENPSINRWFGGTTMFGKIWKLHEMTKWMFMGEIAPLNGLSIINYGCLYSKKWCWRVLKHPLRGLFMVNMSCPRFSDRTIFKTRWFVRRTSWIILGDPAINHFFIKKGHTYWFCQSVSPWKPWHMGRNEGTANCGCYSHPNMDLVTFLDGLPPMSSMIWATSPVRHWKLTWHTPNQNVWWELQVPTNSEMVNGKLSKCTVWYCTEKCDTTSIWLSLSGTPFLSLIFPHAIRCVPRIFNQVNHDTGNIS